MIDETVIYRQYDFAAKKEYRNVGQLFELLNDFAHDHWATDSHLLFMLDEIGAGKISPTERVLKHYPHLSGHQYFREPLKGSSSTPRGLSNLDSRWVCSSGSTDPLSKQDALKITNKIPRSLPFSNVTFIWNHLNWGRRLNRLRYSRFEEEKASARHGTRNFVAPCLMMFSGSFARGRDYWFRLIFDFYESETRDYKRLPEFKDALSVANKIGRQLRSKTIVSRSSDVEEGTFASRLALQGLFVDGFAQVCNYLKHNEQYQAMRYNQKLWMGKIKGEAYPRR